MEEIRLYEISDRPGPTIRITIGEKTIVYESDLEAGHQSAYDKPPNSDDVEAFIRKICLDNGTPLSKLKLKKRTKLFCYSLSGGREVHIRISTKKLLKYTKSVRVQLLAKDKLEPLFEYEQISWKPVGKLIKERLAALVDIGIDDVEEWDKLCTTMKTEC